MCEVANFFQAASTPGNSFGGLEASSFYCQE